MVRPRHVVVVQGPLSEGAGLQVPFDTATQVVLEPSVDTGTSGLGDLAGLTAADLAGLTAADLVVVDTTGSHDTAWVPGLVAGLAARTPGTPVAVAVPHTLHLDHTPTDHQPAPTPASDATAAHVPVHVGDVVALGDHVAVVFDPGGSLAAATLRDHLDLVSRAVATIRASATPDPASVADSERHLLAQLADATARLEQAHDAANRPATVGRRAGAAIDRTLDVVRYTRNRVKRDGVGPTIRGLASRARSAMRRDGERREGT